MLTLALPTGLHPSRSWAAPSGRSRCTTRSGWRACWRRSGATRTCEWATLWSAGLGEAQACWGNQQGAVCRCRSAPPTAGACTCPLHSTPSFATLCSLPGYNKVHSILTNVSEELLDVPLYFNLHDM